SSTQRISLTFSPGSPCQRPPPPCCGWGRLAMRLRFGTSPSTSRCLTTVSSPTALRLSPRRRSSLHQ
ncbi:unnamed protein product, partial [Closterium sp. NIES-54]